MDPFWRHIPLGGANTNLNTIIVLQQTSLKSHNTQFKKHLKREWKKEKLEI